jgi:predicted acetyltransferase
LVISLDPAGLQERLTLHNLLQLYIYDWSELQPLDVGVDGRFEDYPLDVYWRDAWRHPFLIRVDGQLAGLALVSERSRLTGSAGVTDMAEFFIMRRYRRKGAGLAAAFAAFDRFKGPWEVRQRDDNEGATAFWRRVITRYTNGKYQEARWNDSAWTGPVQRFSTDEGRDAGTAGPAI